MSQRPARRSRRQHPERVHDRKGFLASLVPPVELFDDEDADADPETSEADDA